MNTPNRLTLRITRQGNSVDFPLVQRETDYMRGSEWFDCFVPDTSLETDATIEQWTGWSGMGELVGYAFIEGCAIEQDEIGVLDEGDIGFSFQILLDGEPTTYDAVDALLNPEPV